MPDKKRGFLTYKAFNFIDKNPALYTARTVVADSGMSFKDIHKAGGATVATQRAWFEGSRRSCTFHALMATVRAAGGDIIFQSPKGQQIKVALSRKK